MAIKNIILDLGGVLLDIDYNLTTKAFESLGFENFTEMYSQYTADALFEKLEKGQVTEQEFYTRICSNRPDITSNQIANAWNAMLLHFRFSVFDYIKKLSTQYRIFLLSNTNAIHKNAFSTAFQQIKGYSMDSYFEKAYYSHLIGLRKPNKDIFEFVLNDAGIVANESIFIDDSFNNIDTARSMGFICHLLQKDEPTDIILHHLISS